MRDILYIAMKSDGYAAIGIWLIIDRLLKLMQATANFPNFFAHPFETHFD